MKDMKSFRIIVLLAVFLFLIPKVCYSEEKFGDFVKRGVDYATRADFESAYQEYHHAYQVKKTQLVEKFSSLCKNILNGKIEKDVGIHLFKGLKFWMDGHDPSKAIAEFKWVAMKEPNCELAHYFLGDTYYHSCYGGAEEEISKYVIPAFKKAIEIDPDFALAHFGLAFAYYFSDIPDVLTECKLTVQHFDKAIKLDPFLKDLPSSSDSPDAEELIKSCRQFLREKGVSVE